MVSCYLRLMFSSSHCLIVSWSHGLMVSWSHGLMVSWSHGHMVTWSHGLMVSWSHGLMVSWSHGLMFAPVRVISSETPKPRFPSIQKTAGEANSMGKDHFLQSYEKSPSPG